MYLENFVIRGGHELFGDEKVKKALIIYAILLVLTVIVPAIVCFSQSDDSSSKELINIFNTFINAMSF